MPNRIIRDAILDSERYHGLSSDRARLLFFELLLLADDFGLVPVGAVFLRRKTTALLHASDEVTAKILGELADLDLIRTYEMRGTRYAFLPRFGNAPRAKKPKWPAPPAGVGFNEFRDLAEKRIADAKHMHADAQQMRPKTEDRRPKTEGQTFELSAPELGMLDLGSQTEKPFPGFAAFWASWPQHRRKSDKARCEQHWRAHDLEPIAPTIIARVDAWRRSPDWRKDGGQFIPAPLVWLRRAAYEAPAPAEISADEQIPPGQGMVIRDPATGALKRTTFVC